MIQMNEGFAENVTEPLVTKIDAKIINIQL